MNLGPRRVLGCAFLLAALASPRAEAAELTFNLVAEEDWLAGRTEPDRFIPGQVLLYPVGSYQPWRVVETGRPVDLPAGEWTWIAEAPGWAAVLASALGVDAEGDPPPRKVVTPVVPACKIYVADREGLRRLERLDLVSLDRGAAYPLVGGVREEAWVPAGRVLTYGVGARGLSGISRPFHCAASVETEVELPAPPPPGRQDLMVSVRLPGSLNPPAPVAKRPAAQPPPAVSAAPRIELTAVPSRAD